MRITNGYEFETCTVHATPPLLIYVCVVWYTRLIRKLPYFMKTVFFLPTFCDRTRVQENFLMRGY